MNFERLRGASLAASFACVLVVSMVAGCASDDEDTSPSDSGATDTDAPSDSGAGDAGTDDAGGGGIAEGKRDERYCELLFAYPEGRTVRVDVYGTQELNDCPADLWGAIDTESLQDEYGAAFIKVNGPRHWVIDTLQAFSVPSTDIVNFGGIEMRQLAVIELPLSDVQASPYRENTVNRDSQFTYNAGSEVYELSSPDGSVYVMQSYAQIVDPSLTIADLPGLGARLELPEGWTYASRVLTEPLIVLTRGEATVLQDELENSYSRYVDGTP